jgi:DNA-binding SARP family transcriptional activator
VVRALDCWTTVRPGIGGAGLADAEAAARKLIAEARLRERGYVLLMRVLNVREDSAEAVRVYDRLRPRLNDNLGIAPGPRARESHARILLRDGDRER